VLLQLGGGERNPQTELIDLSDFLGVCREQLLEVLEGHLIGTVLRTLRHALAH